MGDAYSPPQESLTRQSDIYSLHLNGGGRGWKNGDRATMNTFRSEGGRRPQGWRRGRGVEAVPGESADSWQGTGRRMRSPSKPCRTGNGGGRGSWRGHSERRLGRRARAVGSAEATGRRAQFWPEGEDSGESWATGRQHRRRQGGRSCRTRRGRGSSRCEEGRAGATGALKAAGRLGDPNPRGSGGTGRRGALTGVPPHGAAGGLLPQMREEEVPGGLEVLEVAELDNGASHGSGNPARAPTAPHHALPPETPRLPQPSPHCFSRAGAGKPNRKLSARSGLPPRSAAHARNGPGAGGWRVRVM